MSLSTSGNTSCTGLPCSAVPLLRNAEGKADLFSPEGCMEASSHDDGQRNTRKKKKTEEENKKGLTVFARVEAAGVGAAADV